MSLQVWNASAFTEGDPKVWNGSAFVSPESAHIWDGSQFVEVWSAAPPVVFSAVGAGAVVDKNGAGSFTITVAAGDVVILGASGDAADTPAVATYNGVAMTLLARVPFNNNESNTNLHAYGYLDTVGGTRTINWDGDTADTVQLNAVAYSGYVSHAVETSYGTGSPASQSVTCPPGRRVVQLFGADQATWTPSGGTNRANSGLLTISDADVSTTFSNAGTVGNWGGIAVILSNRS